MVRGAGKLTGKPVRNLGRIETPVTGWGSESMFARLALLFVVVPILELALLIQIGQVVGLLPTVALVLATGVGGAALARREGLRTVSAIQRDLAQGRLPETALMDGAAILFGGALLLTPGVLTDLVGLGLLLPATRRWFARRMRAWFDRQLAEGRVHWSVGGPGMGVWSSGGPGMGPRQGEDRTHDLDPRHEIDGSGEGR